MAYADTVTKAAGAQTGDPAVLRPPLAQRIYVAVFLCFWCGGVLTMGAVAAVHRPSSAVAPVLMFAFGTALGYRLLRMSVVLGPEHLLVRNYFQTRRVPRAEVEGFRIGSISTQPFRRTVYLLRRDGSVLALDALSRFNLSARRKAVLAERMGVLQRWFDSH